MSFYKRDDLTGNRSYVGVGKARRHVFPRLPKVGAKLYIENDWGYFAAFQGKRQFTISKRRNEIVQFKEIKGQFDLIAFGWHEIA